MMPALKKTIVNEIVHNTNIMVPEKKSHANDLYVLKKVEQAKAFIKHAGLPKLSKTS